VKDLLKRITRHRVIVFCSSIAQSKELGMNSINSKDGIAQDILDKFNKMEINKVTCCQILNEGVNVTDCRIGVFANLNASETITIQRSGRILRHTKPLIIIPYYINTRDEQLMNKMIQNYDPNMIVKINDLNELKEHLK
jgi:superfamily II DNA or RNA helicase